MSTPTIPASLSERSDPPTLKKFRSRTDREEALASYDKSFAKNKTEDEYDYRTAEIIFAATIVFVTVFPMIFMRILLSILHAM